jgi:hypothetical protein
VWGVETIRILVLREMPEAEQNLVWNLFSSEPARIATAFRRLQPQLARWSSLLNRLLGYYGLEGIAMPYTMEDFERDATEDFLNKLTPEQLLAQISRERRRHGLSPEQLLSLLPLADIENYVKKRKAAEDKGAAEQPEAPA